MRDIAQQVALELLVVHAMLFLLTETITPFSVVNG